MAIFLFLLTCLSIIARTYLLLDYSLSNFTKHTFIYSSFFVSAVHCSLNLWSRWHFTGARQKRMIPYGILTWNCRSVQLTNSSFYKAPLTIFSLHYCLSLNLKFLFLFIVRYNLALKKLGNLQTMDWNFNQNTIWWCRNWGICWSWNGILTRIIKPKYDAELNIMG